MYQLPPPLAHYWWPPQAVQGKLAAFKASLPLGWCLPAALGAVCKPEGGSSGPLPSRHFSLPSRPSSRALSFAPAGGAPRAGTAPQGQRRSKAGLSAGARRGEQRASLQRVPFSSPCFIWKHCSFGPVREAQPTAPTPPLKPPSKDGR